MILEKQTENIEYNEGHIQESIAMSLDLDSADFLMQMLSKNFYSDSIGSTVREYASNALDSHRKANITEPIIVSLSPAANSNYEFSVEDFGVGLDDIDFRGILSKYGKSTKRESKVELGMYGLGAKAGLSYSSTVFFICRKNGMERKYMMYEGEDKNSIDLLYEKPTDERNGVKVIVPVRYSDKYQFIEKIKEQLAYFEGVYFKVDGISNDFIIHRHEHFQWSPLSQNDELHICLDNVYYPLDFNKLGIDAIKIPVALRFNLTDGIFPIPNREQLKMSQEAKKLILDKIAKVADFFVTKYNESIQDTDNITDIFDYYKSSYRYVSMFGKTFNITPFITTFNSIKIAEPKLKNVELLDLKRMNLMKDSFFCNYEIVYNYANGKFTSITNNWGRTLTMGNIDYPIYVFSDKVTHKQKQYFRDTLGSGTRHFVRERFKIGLGDIKIKYGTSNNHTYYQILELWKYPKNQWRQLIKEWQYIQSLFTSKFINLDNFVVPQDWIDGKKKIKVAIQSAKGSNIRRKKLEGEVGGRYLRKPDRYVSGKNAVLEPITINLASAHKEKRLLIYGDVSQQEKMDKWFTVVDFSKVRLVIFSEREIKKLKDINLHNWIKMEDLENGKHKIFKRIVTAYLINKLYSEYSNVFDKLQCVKEVSTVLAAKMQELREYEKVNHVRGAEEIYKAALTVAEEHNLFDLSIYGTYKEVKYILDRLPFLKPIFSSIASYYRTASEEQMIPIVRDLFKYYKQKIDWQHYKLPINEPVKEELTEEILEELEEGA